MDPAIHQRFAGIDRLYGRGALERLTTRHVAVIGIGGVGSWVVEGLARSGVGRLTLIDADEICITNSNRQLHALDGQFGRLKVEAMAERARAIHPAAEVNAVASFLTPSNLEDLLGAGFDLVIDACDAFRVKVETIAWCRRRKQPLIVVGSAGGRADPTKVQVRDLSRTEHDALLALIRKKLRQEFRFPDNPRRFFGVPAVYSLENARFPQPDGGVGAARPEYGEVGRLDCEGGLGAAAHVTATFGFVAVGEALRRLLRTDHPSSSPRTSS
jgi:tRNA threonylcarbamoyladenosine dehydratase